MAVDEISISGVGLWSMPLSLCRSCPFRDFATVAREPDEQPTGKSIGLQGRVAGKQMTQVREQGIALFVAWSRNTRKPSLDERVLCVLAWTGWSHSLRLFHDTHPAVKSSQIRMDR